MLFEARARGGIILFSLIDIMQVVFLSYWIYTFSCKIHSLLVTEPAIEYDQRMQDFGWVSTPFMKKTIYALSFGAIGVWLAFSR